MCQAFWEPQAIELEQLKQILLPVGVALILVSFLLHVTRKRSKANSSTNVAHVISDMPTRIIDIVGIAVRATTLETSQAVTGFALDQGSAPQATAIGANTMDTGKFQGEIQAITPRAARLVSSVSSCVA